jgi:hypothetical protein
MASQLRSPAEQVATLRSIVDAFQSAHPKIGDIAHDVELRRWYIRLHGGTKDPLVVWVSADERTVTFETYLAPWPQHHVLEVFEYLLRASRRLDLVRVAIGDEDAIYLYGRLQWDDLAGDTASQRFDEMIGATVQYADELYSVIVPLGFEPFGLQTSETL